MMSMGERIKSARIMAGLSQRGLAEQAHVSAMAISKYERDMDIPGSPVLLRLARALNVRVEYFFRLTTVTLSFPSSRHHKLLPEEQKASLLEHIQDGLERYLEVENLLGKTSSPQLPQKYHIEMLDDIEDAALDLRKQWNLGSNALEGLIELCENRGIKVGLADGYLASEALTLWANNRIPVIVLRGDIPGDRQRLYLARELGRILLELADNVNSEQAANRFARAFLAPRLAVETELGPKRHTLSLYELHLLKHTYGLSMQDWVHRARDLGIISKDAAIQITEFFRQQGWQHEEPGDALPSEEPQRFQRLVVHALSEGIISQARSAELLGISLSAFIGGVVEKHGGLPFEMCG